jgi:hypothetical protein
MNVTTQTANRHTFSWYSNSKFISSVTAIIGVRTGWFIGMASMYFVYFTPWWMGDGLWWHYNIVMYLYGVIYPFCIYIMSHVTNDHPLGVPPFGWTNLSRLTFLYCVHQPPTLTCPPATKSIRKCKGPPLAILAHICLQQSAMLRCYILQLSCSWLLTRQFCNFLNQKFSHSMANTGSQLKTVGSQLSHGSVLKRKLSCKLHILAGIGCSPWPRHDIITVHIHDH